jgi:hypothetical protein
MKLSVEDYRILGETASRVWNSILPSIAGRAIHISTLEIIFVFFEKNFVKVLTPLVWCFLKGICNKIQDRSKSAKVNLPSLLSKSVLILFIIFNKAFFGKIIHLVEEKDNPLGSEPVFECLPSTRFKSRKNVVL